MHASTHALRLHKSPAKALSGGFESIQDVPHLQGGSFGLGSGQRSGPPGGGASPGQSDALRHVQPHQHLSGTAHLETKVPRMAPFVALTVQRKTKDEWWTVS